MSDISLVNPVIERMKAGEVALGMNIRLARSGDIASIARTTGHDFLFLDAQHAIFSLETLAHIAQAARGAGVAPLVIFGFVGFSFQLIFMGLLGEYIGAIHTQLQRRPWAVERERVNFEFEPAVPLAAPHLRVEAPRVVAGSQA